GSIRVGSSAERLRFARQPPKTASFRHIWRSQTALLQKHDSSRRQKIRGCALRNLLVVTVLVGFSVCCLYAQTFGEVTGRVTDPSGAVIPGASLTLTNTNTNAVRNVVSTEAGAYTFPSIAPGFYRLRTELPGFKAAVSEPFEVQVQQVVRLDVVLQVGQISETVEVAATADRLQAETATVG